MAGRSRSSTPATTRTLRHRSSQGRRSVLVLLNEPDGAGTRQVQAASSSTAAGEQLNDEFALSALHAACGNVFIVYCFGAGLNVTWRRRG